MDCTTLRENLDALRDGQLEPETKASADVHLRNCAACRAYQMDVETLRSTLRDMTPPPMSAERADRGFGVRRWAGYRLPAAMAASVTLAVAVLVGLVTGLPRQAADPDPAGTAGAWQTRTIQLALEAPAPMEAVRFRLELPESVEVQGHPGLRTLEWTDNLAAGSNRLRIPLVLMDEAEGVLMASLEHEGRTRELHVAIAGMTPSEH